MEISAAERLLIAQKAGILKAISHPVRLCIVSGLMRQPCCAVNKIQGCLDLPQSTISQHLGCLRSAGIIAGDRDGTEVRYSVVNEDVVKIIHCLLPEPSPQLS